MDPSSKRREEDSFPSCYEEDSSNMKTVCHDCIFFERKCGRCDAGMKESMKSERISNQRGVVEQADKWKGNGIENREERFDNSDGTVIMTRQQFEQMQLTIQKLSDEVLQNRLDMTKINEVMCKSLRASCRLLNMEDSGYFEGYAAARIHLEMLTDGIRTNAFKKALMENKSLISGKTVLDLGCGTGILSMFAVAAGAKEVIAVDESDILYNAIDIIRENNMDKIITLIKGKIEHMHLHRPVDIIISEWMGCFLLFEGMLDSVVYARNKYLKPGGIMLPSICKLNFMGASHIELYESTVDAWNNIYGFDMSSMRSLAIREPIVEIIDSDKIITTVMCIHSINMATCTDSNVNFKQDFYLSVNKTGLLTHFVGYFDVNFDLPHPVCFTTGPAGIATHWKQTVFSLEKPVNVISGEMIWGTIICERAQDGLRRTLEIQIAFNESLTTYYLN